MGGARIWLWVVVVLIAALFLYAVRAILFPFIAGILISALLEPAIQKLRSRGLSRGLAVGLVTVAFFVLITGVIAFLAPRAAYQVNRIQQDVTYWINNTAFAPTRLERFLTSPDVKEKIETGQFRDRTFSLEPTEFLRWLENPTRPDYYYTEFFTVLRQELSTVGLPTNRQALIQAIRMPSEQSPVDRWLAENRKTLDRLGLPTTREELEARLGLEDRVRGLVDSAIGAASSVFSYLLSSLFWILFTPIITIFILLDYDRLRRRSLAWIPPSIRPAATDLLDEIGEVLSGYVRGLMLSVSLYTVLMMGLLSLLGVPYALFLGILIGAIYLIPYIGNFISVILIALTIVAFGKTGTPFYDFGSTSTYLLVCIGTFLLIGALYDQLVHPNIVGRNVGLPPVVSFFVIFSGGALFGLPGMILAFPVAGTIKVILDRIIRFTTGADGSSLKLPRVPSRHAS
jgi:predicted PurR-regulated permease PerM